MAVRFDGKDLHTLIANGYGAMKGLPKDTVVLVKLGWKLVDGKVDDIYAECAEQPKEVLETVGPLGMWVDSRCEALKEGGHVTNCKCERKAPVSPEAT